MIGTRELRSGAERFSIKAKEASEDDNFDSKVSDDNDLVFANIFTEKKEKLKAMAKEILQDIDG